MPEFGIKDAIDILIVAVLLYYIFRLMKESGTINIFYGVIVCAGVGDIIIDPGFGFAKTLEQNYELMRHLDAFAVFGRPIFVGISDRKSVV